MAERIIGILGGMGPEATVDLMAKIITHTPARTDQEHLRMIVDNNPKVPSRQAAVLEGGEDPTHALCESGQLLERAGAAFIVIPCNSAHVFLEPLARCLKIPIVSMVDETARYLLAEHPTVKTIGLMATEAVTTTGLYARPLATQGVTTLLPTAEEQRVVVDGVFRIKAGDKSASVKKRLLRVARALVTRGAQAILLACTELPLLVRAEEAGVPVIDATDILARAAVREARAG